MSELTSNTRYVSILFVGFLPNANNFDETIGNTKTLHHVTLADGSHTNISGVAVKRAIRDIAQDLEFTLWRQVDEDGNYIYMDNNNVAQRLMVDAAKALGNKNLFDANLFGYMIASKAVNVNARAQVFVSPAISLNTYCGDKEFNLGHKASADPGKSTLNPTSFEEHHDEYAFVMTINAERIRSINPVLGQQLFDTLIDEFGCRALGFGGNHARNNAGFEPTFIAYQGHDTSHPNLTLNYGKIHTIPEIQAALSARSDIKFASGSADVAVALRTIRSIAF